MTVLLLAAGKERLAPPPPVVAPIVPGRTVLYAVTVPVVAAGKVKPELLAWDLTEQQPIRAHAIAAGLTSVDVSQDGGLLAVGRDDGAVEVWLGGD